jgi:hypothetical protein
MESTALELDENVKEHRHKSIHVPCCLGSSENMLAVVGIRPTHADPGRVQEIRTAMGVHITPVAPHLRLFEEENVCIGVPTVRIPGCPIRALLRCIDIDVARTKLYESTHGRGTSRS